LRRETNNIGHKKEVEKAQHEERAAAVKIAHAIAHELALR
jgi:hypothetical protein